MVVECKNAVKSYGFHSVNMMQAGVIYKCDRALPEACEYDNGSNKRYK